MVVRKLPADGEGDDGGAVAGSEIFSSLFQGPGVALGKLLIAGMQKKLRQRADRVERARALFNECQNFSRSFFIHGCLLPFS